MNTCYVKGKYSSAQRVLDGSICSVTYCMDKYKSYRVKVFDEILEKGLDVILDEKAMSLLALTILDTIKESDEFEFTKAKEILNEKPN